MKKLILSSLLLLLGWSAIGQLKYKENAKIYVDAGLQIAIDGGAKIGVGARINNKLQLGLGLAKSFDSGLTSIGIDAKFISRKVNKRAGFLMHGGYYTSVISGFYYDSVVYPEFGIGAIIDNFSISVGFRTFLITSQWGDYPETSILFQTIYHFGSMDPSIKRKKNTTYYRDRIQEKKDRKQMRYESPAYFDATIGFANMIGNVSTGYSNSFFNYNVAVGWQKSPWLGIGLNYTFIGAPGYSEMKSLGVSWRARPKFGYIKTTLGLYGDFGHAFRRYSLNIDYKKRATPPSLDLEIGVRCWDMLLIKAGYFFQTPFDMEVMTQKFNSSPTPNQTTEIQRIELGYLHFGVGIIL